LPNRRSRLIRVAHRQITCKPTNYHANSVLQGTVRMLPFSGMTADFVKQLIKYRERNGTSGNMNGIAKALEAEVLQGEIEAAPSTSNGYPQFRYRPQEAVQAVRINRSSSMVSQLAPLVLFLRGVIQRADTLIIEVPEAHLHPRAQTKIAITLARLVRAGVRVVITTHSAWLLEQIGNLMREGELEKLGEHLNEPAEVLRQEEVGGWLFEKNGMVAEIAFNPIEGIELREYGDVAEELYNCSVDLRTRLKETKGGSEGNMSEVLEATRNRVAKENLIEGKSFSRNGCRSKCALQIR